MRLVQVHDICSAVDTTIKIVLNVFDDIPGDLTDEVCIHQIEGSYETEEMFDKASEIGGSDLEVVNFLSLSVVDARKLVNALIEEIKNTRK